jgi:hypothetical protein
MFPFLPVVIGMAQNVADENLLAPVTDPRDQPALVVADVENYARPNVVRVLPALLYIREMEPIGILDYFVPSRQ